MQSIRLEKDDRVRGTSWARAAVPCRDGGQHVNGHAELALARRPRVFPVPGGPYSKYHHGDMARPVPVARLRRTLNRSMLQPGVISAR